MVQQHSPTLYIATLYKIAPRLKNLGGQSLFPSESEQTDKKEREQSEGRGEGQKHKGSRQKAVVSHVRYEIAFDSCEHDAMTLGQGGEEGIGAEREKSTNRP